MDLDSLLADLDLTASKGAKAAAPAPPPPAPAAHAPPPGRAPQPPAAAAPPPPSAVNFDDLQGLMDDLTAAAKSSSSEFPAPPLSKTTAAEVKSAEPAKPVPAPAPAPKPAAAIDDLDALVDSLDATAKEAAATHGTPAPAQKAPTPATVATPPPQQPQQAKAAATIDALDDLLGQLSGPGPVAAQAPARPAQQQPSLPPMSAPSRAAVPAQQTPFPRQQSMTPAKPKDELDGLLANLSSEMSKIDADAPSSRGMCGRCGRPITGEVIQAMGKMWHPEHFTCASCKQPLGTATFYESEGQPNCERCWKALYCPRCAHCDQPIADRCITALGKKWHADHFICVQCLQPLDGGFFERDGKPYCERDFYSAFSAKCAGCDQPIRGECINALGVKWHPDHFACFYCHKSFAGGAFFEYQGKPYCECHYYQMTGSLCAGCGKPVGTRSITALEKKWHPEHFVCAFCNNALGGGSFKEQGGKAYCNACHVKLFG